MTRPTNEFDEKYGDRRKKRPVCGFGGQLEAQCMVDPGGSYELKTMRSAHMNRQETRLDTR